MRRAYASLRSPVACLAVLISLSPLLVACGSASEASVSATVRDSAGIRIVENSKPQWGAAAAWRFADAPSLDIGVFEGDPEYQLFRVSGAVRLSDGRIVVANAGTHELRYFTEDGVYERSSGREGGGPGEFERLGFLRRMAGDTVFTFDFSARRVSFFDPAGEFARSFTVEASQGFAFLREHLEDGSFVFASQAFGSGQREDGLFRDTATWLRYSSDGVVLDTLRRFPEMELFMKSAGSGSRVMIMGVPFGRSTQAAARGNHLLVGTAESFEIGEYDSTGTLVALIRKLTEPVPLDQAAVDNYVETVVVQSEQDAVEARKRWEGFPWPDVMPPYASFRVDADGNLWVEVHEDPAARTASQFDRGSYAGQWHVFDPDGQWLGIVQAPAGFRPTDIGADYVLGTWQDELDVEHVRMYELVKS